MAFNLKRSEREPMSEINVTPFVDVMLVLLIIFMVTAPLLTVGVQVDLPETSADTLPEESEPLTLTINSKGEVFIQETKIEFMSQRKFGFILSGTLLIVGLLSLLINQGPKLSIDFKGGTMVAVNFTEPVDINKIRNSMSDISIDGQKFDFSNNECL